MTFDREQMVARIAEEVVARLRAQMGSQDKRSGRRSGSAPGADGVFPTVDEAVKAAAKAQEKVAAMSLEDRGRIIAVIRRLCEARKQEFARTELEESTLGRLDHKIQKLESVKNVLGVEALRIEARSDATGLCVIERAPWGVIGMVCLPRIRSRRWPATPST